MDKHNTTYTNNIRNRAHTRSRPFYDGLSNGRGGLNKPRFCVICGDVAKQTASRQRPMCPKHFHRWLLGTLGLGDE